ncbi:MULTISPECIES: type IV pilus biogenesis protein PilM [Dethiosulfovibrio]|uniref:Pilus assembly protein PilM n=2 Tax=Dethiosulfovibrio TaxID=47054 RepID=A0ABS9EQ30_9BACT|nr:MULTISPECIES: pilus assembly protein PilM [Dethiosulfovibrio]MCF4113540.1 pilus assembly protein PilM [Dethiosulfovibrio russensis]MCF4142010.1 pilus assembly protein PilM [Dethiosulfovibrio marinus]MCF4144165.1 pilus assembly protein PilM [Dethiosulfovibrio acidaminovorans]
MSFWKKNRKKDGFAGLAIMTNGIYYLELLRSDTDLAVNRYEFISYSHGAVKQDSLVDQEEAVRAIGELSDRIGGFGFEVALGIPSRDVMIKNVEFPDMDLEMAKDALHWNFDKNFPYDASEALYDADVIELPDGGKQDRVHLVVAAVRRSKIQGFLERLRDDGLPLSSMEPNNVAAFRAISRGMSIYDHGYIVLIIAAESLQMMIGYRESSLLFRSVPFPTDSVMSMEELSNRVVSEIQATGNYVRTLFRGINLSTVLLAGDVSVRGPLVDRLKTEFNFSVDIVDPWLRCGITGAPDEAGEADVVVGLAARNLI